MELLDNLKCVAENLDAESLRQLQPALELKHRIATAEAVARHTLFSEETRWPGYYYRADHPKLDDDQFFACLHRRTSAGRYASRRRRPRSPPSP